VVIAALEHSLRDGDFATFLAQEDVAEAFKRLYPKNLS
jgi:hypothetical protein